MKCKKVLSIVLVTIMLISNCAIAAEKSGIQTTEHVYAISTPEDLIRAGSALSCVSSSGNNMFKIILLNDIDMAGYDWNPIEAEERIYGRSGKTQLYAGIFDGNGKTIKNLTIGSPDNPNKTDRYLGLFGRFEGIIEDLKLESFNIYSGYNSKYVQNKIYAGGLVGYNEGNIRNCSVSGTIHLFSPYAYTGLIAGENDSIIHSCQVQGSVKILDKSSAGGITAKNNRIIHNCSSAVDIVAGENSHAGGICGINTGYKDSHSTLCIGISNCHTTSNIEIPQQATAGIFVGNDESNILDNTQKWYWNSDSKIKIINTDDEQKYPVGNLQNLTLSPMSTDEMQNHQFVELLNEGIDSTGDSLMPTVSQWYLKDDNDYPKIYNIIKAENTWSGYIKKPEIQNGNTFIIREASELAWYAICGKVGFSEKNKMNIVLQNDIDLGGKFWTPFYFNGTFNGQGYQIKNLTIGTEEFYDRSRGSSGLFSSLGNNAVVKNLGLTNLSVFAKLYPINGNASNTGLMGGLSGTVKGSKIYNCYVTGSITIDDTMNDAKVGLISADTEGATISNCYVSGNVTDTNIDGALFGQALNNPKIENCYWNKDATNSPGIGKPSSTENGLSFDEMKSTSFTDTLNQNVADSKVKNLLNWTIKDNENNGLPVLVKKSENPSPSPSATPTEAPVGIHSAYMNGYPDGSFRPADKITRAETAALFSKLYQSSDIGNSQPFADVPENAWYAQAVRKMSAQGLITGYEDGTFRPDSPVTRAEFAVLVTKFLKQEPVPSDTIPFTDVPSNWATPYILSAYSNGQISGYEDGTFRPNNHITRAEAVTILNRALNRVPDPSKIDAELGHAPDIFPDVQPSHWAYYNIIEACHEHKIDLFHK